MKNNISTPAFSKNGPQRNYAFRILNVFATAPEAPFSGNPLAVFEDGRGLSDTQMQALARQMNLSETTFLLPAQGNALMGSVQTDQVDANARVRIFTPDYEMPFAGHPTLGSAHVLAELISAMTPNASAQHPPQMQRRVRLSMQAGLVDVSEATFANWTLQAPLPPTAPPQDDKTNSAATFIQEFPSPLIPLLAAAYGLTPQHLSPQLQPAWSKAGVRQLVLPVKNTAILERVTIDSAAQSKLCLALPDGQNDAKQVLLWAYAQDKPGTAVARFFFLSHGAMLEDPATGSACANLGAYLLARTGQEVQLQIHQGAHTGRPSLLHLQATPSLHSASGAAPRILVGGLVRELGAGTIWL